MFFKRKNKSDKGNNVSNTCSEADQNERKLTIEAVENALQKNHKTEDKITLLKVAGDAYFSGDIGAEKNYEKAIKFYQEAADLGSVECLHCCGVAYISAYWGGDEMLFSLGVVKVCESYRKGFAASRDTLQYLIDSGVFQNCATVEDLLALKDFAL